MQAVGIDEQHDELDAHDQMIVAGDRGHDQDDVGENAEDPERDHGLHRGGRDHEDRREQRARGPCMLSQM